MKPLYKGVCAEMNFSRLIDITQPLFNACPDNPAFPPMEVLNEMRVEEHGWNTERLNFFTHIGTHIDAPKHRKNKGNTIDTMPLNTFIGPATAIDLHHKVADEGIFPDDLKSYEKNLKKIAILYTGWGEKRSDTDIYINHSPWLSKEAALWFVQHGICGVGIDHFSIGGANLDRVEAPHDILLSAGIWILESLLLPQEILNIRNLYIIALPLLLIGGSGAPARAIAAEYV